MLSRDVEETLENYAVIDLYRAVVLFKGEVIILNKKKKNYALGEWKELEVVKSWGDNPSKIKLTEYAWEKITDNL